MKDIIFNVYGVEIYQVSNFLTDHECEHLCQYIKHNNQRSTVSGHGFEPNAYTEARSSNSTNFDPNDRIVRVIEDKIAREVNVPLSYSEPLQGIIYREGQQFKDHTDFFDQPSLINHGLASGQRTWTVMIYLNDVEAGGHTEFPEIGRSFAPRKGTAVVWKNSEGKGTENPATLHCGMPVVKGEKLIVTKWFREKQYRPTDDDRLAKEYHDSHNKPNDESLFVEGRQGEKVQIDYVDGLPHARYKSIEHIPRITKEGFKKMQIPPSLYEKILSFYQAGRRAATPEFDPDGSDQVKEYISSSAVRFPTEMIWLTDNMKTIIFDALEETLGAWSGRKIGRTHCYGIRTYKRGAVLKKHTDGFETRIISAILNVDQKIDEPWALQIDDHQGFEHEVFLQPGQMVLYESAILKHGRVKEFKGDYYTNLFVHYVNLS